MVQLYVILPEVPFFKLYWNALRYQSFFIRMHFVIRSHQLFAKCGERGIRQATSDFFELFVS